MLCATVEDEPRFKDLIGQWIVEGSVPELPEFVGETRKKKPRGRSKLRRGGGRVKKGVCIAHPF